MKEVAVDDDVVAEVWKLAKPEPFENLTFNSAMRRILNLDGNARKEGSTLDNYLQDIPKSKMSESQATNGVQTHATPHSPARRQKAPKANLRVLARSGKLNDGEKLFLVDYKGNCVKQFAATVSNNGLIFDGKYYSMSALARELLKRIDYKSNSVRGPARWVTADGNSIKDLWKKHLKESR